MGSGQHCSYPLTIQLVSSYAEITFLLKSDVSNKHSITGATAKGNCAFCFFKTLTVWTGGTKLTVSYWASLHGESAPWLTELPS